MSVPYCLNIHPGESLAAVREAITTHARAVKAAVSPDAPYPLGLRLAEAAVRELVEPAALDSFRALLAEYDLYATAINGFPYGVFHGAPVKTEVYRPDWTAPERLSYTACLAKVLAAILPEGFAGNVSTVPLGYKGAGVGRQESDVLYARQLAIMAEFLHDLKERTGREIVLALEPEPDCLLENTADVVAWFEDVFLYEGRRWLAARRRHTPEEAEALLRRYVGVCLDTCHFAVAFEDPLAALLRFESASLRVARIQLSAAVRAMVTDASLKRLAAFVDPVYLHQTKIRLPRSRIQAFPDLTPETLEAARQYPGCELRTHFHVPLFFGGDDTLGSTRVDLTPAFFAHADSRGYPLEIETYTFDVLPPELRPGSVVESLVKETRWVQAALPTRR